MPGNLMTPSLAESWTVSADQRAYEFKLREGVKFHNGDPFTAEDVKFSFQRAKGTKVLRDKVQEVVVVGPHRVRFQLHEPWPDFMTFYGTLVSGGGLDRPQEVHRAGRRRRLPEAPHRPRALQVRQPHARASSWSWRPTRATGARCPR